MSVGEEGSLNVNGYEDQTEDAAEDNHTQDTTQEDIEQDRIQDNPDITQLRRGERSRIMTKKAQENLQQKLQDKFIQAYRAFKTTSTETKQTLGKPCVPELLQDIKDNINFVHSQVDDAYKEMRENMDSVPHDIRLKEDQCDEEIHQILQKIADKESELPEFSHHSRLSQKTSSSTSSRQRLLKAQAAALQIQKKARQKEDERRAEIDNLELEEMTVQAEAVALRAQQEAEEKIRRAKSKVEIERKRRELEDERLAVQLQANEAELMALETATDQDLVSEDMGYRNRRDETLKVPVTTTAHEVIKSRESTTESTHSALKEITSTLTNALNRGNLPTLEPTVFNGDVLKYPSWKASFTSLIESRKIAPVERIYYLKKYLSGDAREVIEGTFFFETEEAYENARKILDERYGDSFLVAEAFRDKLHSWPKINGRDSLALRKLGDFLRQCLVVMNHVKGLSVLNDCRENRKLLAKLPDWLVQRWSRIAANKEEFPDFKTFANFIVAEAKIACNPITSIQISKTQREDSSQTSARRLPSLLGATILANDTSHTTRDHKMRPRSNFEDGTPSQADKRQCLYCKRGNHQLNDCWSFASTTPQIRSDFIKRTGLCFGCLSHGHVTRDCPSKSTCAKCQRNHPTPLHGDFRVLHPEKTTNQTNNQIANQITNQQAVSFNSEETDPSSDTGTSHRAYQHRKDERATSSMILPVYLSSITEPDQELLVYAMLDTQSDTTFVLEKSASMLRAETEPTRLKLTTMTSTEIIQCSRYTDLQIRGYNSDKRIHLPATYSRNTIPVHRSHIPTKDTARRWPHLKRIEEKLPELLDCEVSLLIGYNCPQALAPRDFIRGTDNEPFAQETDLGWCIVGCTSGQEEDNKITHKISHHEQPLLANQIIKTLEADFPERKTEEKTISQEDLKFLRKLENTIHQDDTGHYTMPLPWKNEKPDLPNNRIIARHRLDGLKRRFRAQPKYFEQYKEFMNQMLERGDAEEVDDTEPGQRAWYIPHHGVYHPKKPNKLRVVFDCSAKHKGTSLNDHLLQGPDLLNSLVGVLCRFREDPIAVVGDVEKMFHQFRVEPEDRDYLRFLWWKDEDLDREPKIYRMKVHLFGAVSSPGCANFGLKRLAMDNKEEFEDVYDFLTRDFYVDDGLRSFATAEDAIQAVNDARLVCARGQLRLHKFISNSPKVMASIPESERGKDARLNINFTIERVLGIEWCVESDNFQFRMTITKKPTRRGVLATVASIYDPLGFLAPFVLIGKQILQKITREKKGWDDPLPVNLQHEWERWLTGLKELPRLSVDRCLTPKDFKINHQELHHFSDASFSGYGQCSYLRSVSDTGDVHCALIIGKARVVPTKIVTLPRLELTAATVSAKMSSLLRYEMKYKAPETSEFFWTDSQVVLGYIRNNARRFHVFVANRVQEIQNMTSVDQWYHVPSEDNPADHASRGLFPDELMESSWIRGPAFLWRNDIEFDKNQKLANICEEDPEVRKAIVRSVKSDKDDSILKKLERFSTWRSVITAISVLIKRTKGKIKSPLKKEDRRLGENIVIKAIQRATSNLRSEKLHKLDPFVDDEGLVRVGGRLKASQLDYGVKHPIILPKDGHLVQLLIKHVHEKTAHQGRGLTLNELRANGYWIIGGSRAVSSFIFRCITCRKLRGQNQNQKMSNLPEDRIEPAPPFTHCGIDCFGPFIVKDLRKEHKRYGLLITCMASRAIHIETLDDMTTDAFINALRCFIALRGPVRTIRSDQGSNFIGAINVLKNTSKEIKESRLRDYLAENDCDFILNSPHSSHMGGSWERHIRTIRSILTAILHQHKSRLDTSSLRTFLYETMAIVNNRPLMPQNLNDAGSPEPLTPNHLVTMKTKTILPPPGDFVREDVYARKRWRKVQYMASEFWARWRKEYVLQLQSRDKWTKLKRNLSVGDIVILKDEEIVRGQWHLARIIEVIQDKDDLVRRVKILLADGQLSDEGKRVLKPCVVERPIHKLVLLMEKPDEKT